MIDKALALEPRQRFASVREMLDLLHSKPIDQPLSEPKGTRRRQVFEFIRKKIERKGDFPATSRYMAEVTAIANAENSSATAVSNTILKDFSLTNRILRMVNSP